MISTRLFRFPIAALCALFLAGCLAGRPAPIPVDQGSVEPGTSVTRGGTPLTLLGTPIALGQKLPSAVLVDTHLQRVDLAGQGGSVLFLSIVPSLDTGVCERQTHILGEEGARLPAKVRRVTISRDLPFAQKRFAEEAKLTDIQYLSDYRDASFGRATGLLVDELMLLARAVVLVDSEGNVRYIQVVPELSHLPDMDAAFAEARRLAAP